MFVPIGVKRCSDGFCPYSIAVRIIPFRKGATKTGFWKQLTMDNHGP